MSGVVKFVAGAALMFLGMATGQLWLAKAGFYLANLGLIEEVSRLFMPKPNPARLRHDVEYSGTVTPRTLVYGKLRVGGLNTMRPVVGDTNGKKLNQVLTIAGHVCNAIPTVYFNETAINDGAIRTIDRTVDDGKVTSGTYQDLAYIRRYLGTQTQHDWKLPGQAPGIWTSAHIGYGVTYAAIQYRLDEKVYATGKPAVAFLVEGKKCYDPRLDVTPGASPTNAAYIAYTTNPALQLADYLMDTALGRGIAAAKIDWTLCVAAANECDELVSIPPASPATTQKRYTSSLTLEASGVRHEENIKALASAMMGICYRQGGKYRMYAGAALSPSFTLTEADIVGSVSIRRETPMGEKYNFVRGTFTDADRNYQESEYEPRSNSAYETADRLRLTTTADFDSVTNAYEAQRNALIVLRRSRMKETLTARFSLAAFKVRPFMVGTMTLADLGWSAQRVVCTSWRFLGDGTIEMTLQEDSSTIWDDPTVGSYTEPGSGGSGTSQAYVPDPPDNLVATSIPGGISFVWDMPLETLAGDVIELWEYTASTPFASATKIWEGAASGVIIDKADTTTRYYWIRARAANTNPSSTEPTTTGVAGVALPDPTDGSDGDNVATVFIYQRTATDSAPTLPSATTTYTFATGGLTGLNNGWTATVPSGTGAYLWVSTATAASVNATDDIASGEWAAARKLATDGADGLTVSLSNPYFAVQCDSAGVPISGAFTNAVGQVTVYSGATDVTSTTTFAGTTSSVTGSVNTATNTPVTGARGSYRVTALSAESGYLEITATYGSKAVVARFNVSKVRAGAASSSASDTGFSNLTLAAYPTTTESGQSGGVLEIAIGPNGTVSVGYDLYISRTPTEGAITGTVKVQYRESGTTTWTDVTSSESSDSTNYEDPSWVPGYVTVSNLSITEPTTQKLYQFRLIGYTSNVTYPVALNGVFSVSWAP